MQVIVAVAWSYPGGIAVHYISGVMPNMSHCQITCSTRFAQHVGIITPNPNPTTNPTTNPNANLNPKTLTLT